MLNLWLAWRLVELYCFDKNRTAGWSSYTVWTETGLLVGHAILFEQKPACLLVKLYCLDKTRPAGCSSYIVWTETGLLIGRALLFGQKPAWWLVKHYHSRTPIQSFFMASERYCYIINISVSTLPIDGTWCQL